MLFVTGITQCRSIETTALFVEFLYSPQKYQVFVCCVQRCQENIWGGVKFGGLSLGRSFVEY